MTGELQGFWAGIVWGLATLVAFGIVVAYVVMAYIVELGVARMHDPHAPPPRFEAAAVGSRIGLKLRTGRWTTKEERAEMARQTGVPLDDDEEDDAS
jgi:hypothetical protein